ncbi:MAG: tetratricopeptide repeat protein [Paracoccaceae bacterium]|nr:tetratricopeptide repeat protein [Paracoccaceae bacterium]
MRHIMTSLCLGSALVLSACSGEQDSAELDSAFKAVNVIDESGLNDIMLNSPDPNEAVRYFARATAENPERIDLKRGHAKALVRAGKPTQASAIWAQVIASPEATDDDRLGYAEALIRSGEWDRAEEQLDAIPPTMENFDRYRLEAMMADANQEWEKADSFYEIAVGLTTTPAGTLNNWGYSKLTRGEFVEAERMFGEALGYDPKLFTAKNNLVLARGAQRKYDLPIIQMTQVERAQLLHTLGLSAVKQGDVEIGKGLLRDAIETHPQHFDAAARSLAALEANVVN